MRRAEWAENLSWPYIDSQLETTKIEVLPIRRVYDDMDLQVANQAKVAHILDGL